ncbi:MAG: ATP synthase F1 subunit gamma [Clostridia bacterium]|nr:ATP synthase F1 subunit gamma [Clostridia bacterium]
MSSLADIKRRLASVKQTRRITGAMKTVSIAKMRKASENYEKSRAYAALVDEIMKAAATSEGEIYFSVNDTLKKYLLVLSTDRGLCGGFDHDVLRFADGVISENADTVVMPIGRAATEHYSGAKNCDARFSGCYSADAEDAKNVADALLEMFGTVAGEIAIVYVSGRTPIKRVLLPIAAPTDDGKTQDLLLEPSRKDVVDALVPLYVTAAVLDALQSHVLAEHGARQAAMSAATDSADKIIDELSVQYNRARQAGVTEQITEIIGATSALGSNGGDNEKRS